MVADRCPRCRRAALEPAVLHVATAELTPRAVMGTICAACGWKRPSELGAI